MSFITVFGVRHHGPGCARSLRAALEELRPDIVLVEGPPDAHEVLPLLIHEEMIPPVALLVYDPAEPRHAAFYPFAVYSPEWQALRYALGAGVPARFMDLPQAVQFGLENHAVAQARAEAEARQADEDAKRTSEGDDASGAKDPRGDATPDIALPSVAEGAGTVATPVEEHTGTGVTGPDDDLSLLSLRAPGGIPSMQGSGGADVPETEGVIPDATLSDEPASIVVEGPELREDPIGMLAEAAGYDDHELWWEHQIEQRLDAKGLFEGILEAMTTLRAATDEARQLRASSRAEAAPTGPRRDDLREAYMRQVIRQAEREGHERIAVVCGAWHAPVLTAPGPDKTDKALLAGLPRAKVSATWIPWTNGRLAQRSGYGAGVRSPGWYEHLWMAQDKHAVRWLARVAHLLREQDLDASSASVIEAVRLGETLAALRGLPLPGLTDLQEAAQAVLCKGDATPMALIRDKLEVGERLGEVPAETPSVPLQGDVAAAQRRLKLKPSPEEATLDLDVREDLGRARSHLLHRLALLGVPWGQPRRAYRAKGAFHELWQIRWQAEFAVALIEANVWGNTVEIAATAFVAAEGATAALPRLTALLDRAILASLDGAVDSLLEAVRRQAAVSADVRALMEALPPLARVARYGDVRGTQGALVLPVIDALFERIVVGLPGACSALDDDAAAEVVKGMGAVAESLNLLDLEKAQRDEWNGVLRSLLDRAPVHGLVRGWACRLLIDAGVLEEDEVQRLAGLALSLVAPVESAAAWLQGVLRGSGQALLHMDSLWRALDGWIAALGPEAFVEILPLVRRAFSDFQSPERRMMGEKAAKMHQAPTTRAADPDARPLDHERAAQVLPVLRQILGLPPVPETRQ